MKSIVFPAVLVLGVAGITACGLEVPETGARQELDLNDGWAFTLQDPPTEQGYSEVTIPHTWNDSDVESGEAVHYGTGRYRRALTLQPEEGRRYFLRFEGAGQRAVVFVNGEHVGEHLGAYSAFAFDITEHLTPDGRNEILVEANNELAASYPKDNFLFPIYGGVYRGVSLIVTDQAHIEVLDHASTGVYVHQEEVAADEASLRIGTGLRNDGDVSRSLVLSHRLFDGGGDLAAEVTTEAVLAPHASQQVFARLTVDQPRLWHGRRDPHLYRLETRLVQGGESVDEVEQSIGIRTFEIDPERGFILNGEPYRLYGVCRHQDRQGLGSALLPEHHREDMELIRELGATSIRLAHYQQADEMYDLADEMGLLVWAEIPFVNGYRQGADENALQQLEELIRQQFNHPSIFVWGLHNEVIKGTEDTDAAVALTSRLHQLAKELDPGRYTVAASNIWWVYDHPIHELADLQGFNQYTGWYGGQPHELGNWLQAYHEARPQVAFAVSEYGAGGNVAHQAGEVTTPPEPLGDFFPESYQTYYHEQTWAAIEQHPNLWASYVWNMFDFALPEWDRGGVKALNHKGLVTYDRGTRKDAFYWYKANWSDEAVVYLAGRRDDRRPAEALRIKAYSNRGAPELFIGDTSHGPMQPGINRVQYVIDDILLEPGTYAVKIIVRSEEGGELEDEYAMEIVPPGDQAGG